MFPPDSKIMVVDDSSFARTIVKNSLKELKYWKILETDTAKGAQALLQEEEQKADRVSLMIADIHMPNMTGIELLKWIRATTLWKNLPVIILTSSQEKGEIMEAGKLGASHFLIKPFDTAILRDRISSTWVKHGEAWVASQQQPR